MIQPYLVSIETMSRHGISSLLGSRLQGLQAKRVKGVPCSAWSFCSPAKPASLHASLRHWSSGARS